MTEAHLKPTDRFLMERFITAAVSIEVELSPRESFNDISPSSLVAAEYRPQLKAVSIDIETDYQASSLYSIAIYSDDISIVYMVGLADSTSLKTDESRNLEFHQLNSDA